MGKLFVRVDDRLIHGQTIVAWAPTLGISEIIAVDDVSAKNPMLKSIMEMGCPRQYKCHICTSEEAVALLEKECDHNRLVIVKQPHILMNIKEGIRNAEMIYLGNLAKRENTNHQMTGATGIFFLSDQDVEEIDQLVSEGFRVMFQQLPNATGTGWESFRNTL